MNTATYQFFRFACWRALDHHYIDAFERNTFYALGFEDSATVAEIIAHFGLDRL